MTKPAWSVTFVVGELGLCQVKYKHIIVLVSDVTSISGMLFISVLI